MSPKKIHNETSKLQTQRVGLSFIYIFKYLKLLNVWMNAYVVKSQNHLGNVKH